MGRIVGVVHPASVVLGGEQQEDLLCVAEAMLKKLRHRGGKEEVYTKWKNGVFGEGGEALQAPIEGERILVAFSGAVFNEAELAIPLQKRGLLKKEYTTDSLIRGLYIAYGYDFLQKINGTFALAIWDMNKDQLLLARDRIGAVPLFYAPLENEMVFASEIKALFMHPRVKPKVDLHSFRQILGVGPARIPGSGIFADIFEIKPGHFALWDEKGLKEHCYWDISAHPHQDSYEETVERVRWLLFDATQKQIGDRAQLCSLLSGGLDSSIITAVTQALRQKQGVETATYSFGFKGTAEHFYANTFQPSVDTPYICMMQKALGTKHTYLECDELELVDWLNAATEARDAPGMADVDASLLYFCKQIAPNYSLSMTGECADEVFGGYPWFYREELFWENGFPWTKNKAPRTDFLQDDFKKRLDLESFSEEIYRKALEKVPMLEGESETERRRREVGYLSLRWFMCTLLERMDRMGMHSGLSARVPFADYRLIEYVYNVPWEMKYKNGVEKSLLREALGDVLPAEIRTRKKSPFPKTYHPLYEAKVKERLREVLEQKDTPLCSIIDRKKLTSALTEGEGYGKPWFGQLMAMPQLLAYLLQIYHWLTVYQPTISFS